MGHGRQTRLYPRRLGNEAPGTDSLVPPVLFQEVTRRTNLVAYDWELTGRLDTWTYIGQMFRLIFLRDRLKAEYVGAKWINAVVPLLGNAVTEVTRTAPDELSFVRRSARFYLVKLQLLVDWLESPHFPARFPLPGHPPRRAALDDAVRDQFGSGAAPEASSAGQR